MASSGTLYTDVASNYQLSIEWTSSKNIPENYSVVTAKMYWEADRYGSVNSSAVKDGAIVIDGTTYTFSGAGLADLNPGQKKLIATKSKTIQHSSDGTKTFSISGYFDAEVTLSGTRYNRINISSRSFALDTIPRKSSLSSSPSFTAGVDYTLSISRASSSFTHIAYIDVQNKDGSWAFIKSINFSTSETSKSSSFSVTESTRVFNALDGRSSAPMRVNLNTYSGSNNLGYNTYTGTVRSPASSYTISTNGQAGASNKVYLDQTINLDVDRELGGFSHTIEISIPGTSFSKTLNGVGSSTSWTPSSGEQAQLYTAIGSNRTGATGRIRTTTYYNGVQVGSYRDTDLYIYLRASDNTPTFTGSGITYADVNAVTVTVTGNNQYLVKGKSSLRVIIPSGSQAQGKNGATIATYTVALNGISKTVNAVAGTMNIDFGLVDISTQSVVTIQAVDSRGFSTTAKLTVQALPYAVPSLSAIVRRRNNFEETIDIITGGSISPLTVSGAQKNNLQALSGTQSAIQYRYREQTTTTFTNWIDIPYTASNSSYTGTSTTVTLDTTKGYVFEVRVSDKLSTYTYTKTVGSGRPMLYIDPVKNSIGVGMFPRTDKALYTQGEIHVGNPTDETKEIFFGFKDDQPRIRVGGTTKGLDIQGTGDISLFKLDNSGNATLGGNMTMPVKPKAPDFANGWSAYFGGAYFRTVDGVVYMRGMMRYGTFGTGTGTGAVKCFTITDTTCRPLQNQVFYAFNNSMDVIRLDVLTDGTGQIYNNKTLNASNDWVNLNGVYWTVV